MKANTNQSDKSHFGMTYIIALVNIHRKARSVYFSVFLCARCASSPATGGTGGELLSK
jgi:hypothetical protein